MKNQNFSTLFIHIHTANWCPDCVRELPILEKLISNLKLDESQYKYTYYNDPVLYKLNKQKALLPICCVPTFIFKIGNYEIFRVEETIKNNLEESFLKSWTDFNSL